MNKYIRIVVIAVLIFFSTNIETYSQVVKGYVALGSNLSQVDGDEAFGFYKFGLNTGIGAEIQFSKLFSSSIEANFNQKGARRYLFKEGYYLNINYMEVPVLFYITDKTIKFGLGFSYSAPISTPNEIDPRFGLGPNDLFIAVYNKNNSFTSYTDFRLNNNSPDIPNAFLTEVVNPWNTANDKFSRNNFSIIADITFKIWKQLKGNIRYSYSLSKIRTVDYYFYNGINFDNSNTNYDLYEEGSRPDQDFFECFQRKEYNNCISIRLLYYFNEKQVEKTKEQQIESGGELR